MTTRFFLIALLSTTTLFSFGQSNHTAFDSLLKKHVSPTGKVNYKNLKADKTQLAGYIKTITDMPPSADASKNEKLAYWINVYNALTLKLIVDNYPIASITKLDGGKPWDVKRYTIGGKKLSLNDIENEIIRPMGDARIHFAVNCAAKSCPPLDNQAFTADSLDVQLERRTKAFINSSANTLSKGLPAEKANEIKLSKIFDWYGKDFGKVAEFVAKYAKVKVSKTAKISFAEYDWSLNE